MKLCKINYSDLNSKQQEIYNFQKVASVLADFGFNCIKLADDWHGADFLAYRKILIGLIQNHGNQVILIRQ